MDKVFTIDAFVPLVKDMVGAEYAQDGIFVSDRMLWVSELNMIRATCPTCGQEFVGADYNVFHFLAVHEYGHAKMLAIAKDAEDMEKFDDDEKGRGGAVI